MSFSRPGKIGKVYKLFTNVKKYQCERAFKTLGGIDGCLLLLL
jgi:hypothetical protein